MAIVTPAVDARRLFRGIIVCPLGDDLWDALKTAGRTLQLPRQFPASFFAMVLAKRRSYVGGRPLAGGRARTAGTSRQAETTVAHEVYSRKAEPALQASVEGIT
jgi:hypothetical protein